MRSITGEYRGNILSTVIPLVPALRTEKVAPGSVPCFRAITTPSNTCILVLSFSVIFWCTRTVSPALNVTFLRACTSMGDICWLERIIIFL